MSMKRFVPDFKVLTGNSKVTLLLNDYPVELQLVHLLDPLQ
jgi:hypothetical protein